VTTLLVKLCCFGVEQVWGAGNVAYAGTHAEYVVVSSKEVKYFLYFFMLMVDSFH